MSNTDREQIRKIIWVDSNRRAGWHYPDDQPYGPLEVVSVGWLIHEDDRSVTLSASVVFGKDYQASDTMTIPKAAIVSDKTLNKR